MGPANSLHAPAYYSKYNKRFDLYFKQRWSPREHILKSLALPLASKPQVLKKAVIFSELLTLCWKTPETSRKILEDLFCVLFLEIALKILNIFLETLAPVSLASSIPSSVARRGL